MTEAATVTPMTRDEFLSATERQFQDVPIPENFPIARLRGKRFRVWSMDSLQQSRFQTALIDPKTGNPIPERIEEMKARKVVYSVGNDDGAQLFTDADIPAILKLGCGLVDKICEVADELNRFTNPSQDNATKN